MMKLVNIWLRIINLFRHVVPVHPVVQKKKHIILINLSRRLKLGQRKTNNNEKCLKYLEYIEHILLYWLIYENGASCTLIRSAGSDILYQKVCDDFQGSFCAGCCTLLITLHS